MNTPPKWLVEYAIANDCTENLGDWKYRGDYFEAPQMLYCTHGNPDIKTSFVKMYHLTHENKDPYGIGKCEVCGRVLWVKIVPRK